MIRKSRYAILKSVVRVAEDENTAIVSYCTICIWSLAKCYKVLRVIDGEYLEEAGCLGSSDNSVDQCNVSALILGYKRNIHCNSLD